MAKKFFTDNSLQAFVNEIKDYTNDTVNKSVTNITSGDTIVAKATTAETATKATNADEATHAASATKADSATSAASATKATQDASGNVITSTYETKSDATTKLNTAKKYTDDKIATISLTPGPQGDKGDPGTAATITVGTVTTGAAGSSAVVTNVGTTSAAKLNFTIPQGAKGDKGDTGTAGTSVTVSNVSTSTASGGSNVVTFSDGKTLTVKNGINGTNGTNGKDGAAATITVGTVTTGAAGSSAAVTNAGTSTAAKFNFTIPQGAKGDPGKDGADGVTPTIKAAAGTNINTVGTPSVTASTSGTTTTFTFNNLKGAKGDPGVNATTTSVATTSANGLMSSDMVTKLNGIATGANAYTHPSTHAASMITGLSTVATSGSYNDLSNKPTIPSVGNGTVTIKQNGTSKGSFTLNQSGNATIELTDTDTNTDTNTTYDLAASTSSTNGNVKINLTAGGSGSGTDSITVKGTGATTVTTDANGVITINSTDTDTKYTHPTSAGNKHIPAGGSSGQILRWSKAGTAVWGADNDTNTAHSHSAGVGLVGSGNAGTSGTYTYKAKLRSETALTLDSAAATTTSGRVYPVAVDKTGYLAVNVPWTDTQTIDSQYSFSTGSSNGYFTVTPSNGNAYQVKIKGLDTAAYTASTAYATAAQGTKADNAMPKSGGTFTGDVTHDACTYFKNSCYMPNAIAYNSYNKDGSHVCMLQINGSNNLIIGSDNYPHKGNTIIKAPNGDVTLTNSLGDSVIWDNQSGSTFSSVLKPSTHGKAYLGGGSSSWFKVYATTTSIQTSDERAKSDITPIADYPAMYSRNGSGNVFEQLFDKLTPKTYTLNEEDTGELHIGFVAQDVAAAAEELGIPEDNLALVDHTFWTDEETGEEKDKYGLGYAEFIALNTYIIQKQKARITEQEARINDLEERLAKIEAAINA